MVNRAVLSLFYEATWHGTSASREGVHNDRLGQLDEDIITGYKDR